MCDRAKHIILIITGRTLCETHVNKDGTLTFVTDHFSKYAVIGVNVNEKPTKGGGFNTISSGTIGTIALLVGGFCLHWVVINKKRFAGIIE